MSEGANILLAQLVTDCLYHGIKCSHNRSTVQSFLKRNIWFSALRVRIMTVFFKMHLLSHPYQQCVSFVRTACYLPQEKQNQPNEAEHG